MRKTYVTVIDAEAPPLDGSPGDVLMVLKVLTETMENIRDTSPDDVQAVDAILLAGSVAFTESMNKRGMSTGTPTDPAIAKGKFIN